MSETILVLLILLTFISLFVLISTNLEIVKTDRAKKALNEIDQRFKNKTLTYESAIKLLDNYFENQPISTWDKNKELSFLAEIEENTGLQDVKVKG